VDCLTATVNEISSNAGPAGGVSIVTGLILIIGMIGAFPLCSGFEKEEGI
jgi:hypothetical protein